MKGVAQSLHSRAADVWRLLLRPDLLRPSDFRNTKASVAPAAARMSVCRPDCMRRRFPRLEVLENSQPDRSGWQNSASDMQSSLWKVILLLATAKAGPVWQQLQHGTNGVLLALPVPHCRATGACPARTAVPAGHSVAMSGG